MAVVPRPLPRPEPDLQLRVTSCHADLLQRGAMDLGSANQVTNSRQKALDMCTHLNLPQVPLCDRYCDFFHPLPRVRVRHLVLHGPLDLPRRHVRLVRREHGGVQGDWRHLGVPTFLVRASSLSVWFCQGCRRRLPQPGVQDQEV